MSYVERYWDEALVEFPFSPQRPEPEKVVIREVVREPEGGGSQDAGRIHPPCPLGTEFDEWCHDHLLVTTDMTRTDINRDYVLLTKQYRVYYKTADNACRNHTTPNFTCIFHIFHTWLERLEKRERTLIPSERFFFERVAEEEEHPTHDMKLGESLGDETAEEENW